MPPPPDVRNKGRPACSTVSSTASSMSSKGKERALAREDVVEILSSDEEEFVTSRRSECEPYANSSGRDPNLIIT